MGAAALHTEYRLHAATIRRRLARLGSMMFDLDEFEQFIPARNILLSDDAQLEVGPARRSERPRRCPLVYERSGLENAKGQSTRHPSDVTTTWSPSFTPCREPTSPA